MIESIITIAVLALMGYYLYKIVKHSWKPEHIDDFIFGVIVMAIIVGLIILITRI